MLRLINLNMDRKCTERLEQHCDKTNKITFWAQGNSVEQLP